MSETLIALALFAMVSSLTPGPNNLMLMASGANYGFLRTLPHLLGVTLGFTFMIVLVGAGLVQLFEAWPASYLILKLVSTLYLSWLAWKIATAVPAQGSEDDGGKPFTFLQAAMFQWVNPKAWTMALTAITVYAASTELVAVIGTALVFGAVNLPCVCVWTGLGQQLQKWLTNPQRLRRFNWLMAGMLMLSLYPVLMPG